MDVDRFEEDARVQHPRRIRLSTMRNRWCISSWTP